jgi:hypothetical protein
MIDQRLFPKFNVYDQIGYLLVGSIGLLVIYVDSIFLNFKFPKFDLDTSIIWVVVAYFLGHMVQAVANVFIRENKEDFNEQEKRILKIMEEFYGIKALSLSYGEIWNLCYMISLAKDITGQISSFNAYYSLYRGWLIIFAIESVFLLIHLILFFNLSRLIWLMISFSLTVLCYQRSKRFYRYLKTKVIHTSLIIKILGI